jgi:hypothetical protein
LAKGVAPQFACNAVKADERSHAIGGQPERKPGKHLVEIIDLSDSGRLQPFDRSRGEFDLRHKTQTVPKVTLEGNKIVLF